MAPPRVLIITASIGGGHDVPAALLAGALRERAPDAVVTVADGLQEMGGLASGLVEGGSQLDSRTGRALFEAEHWLIARTRPGRAFASWLSPLVGGRGLRALLDRTAPDVVVSTYPGTTGVLGRWRTRGRFGIPVVSAITDLASLHWWAHPGVDLHLVTHPESEPEVRAIAGSATRVVAVQGLSDPRFFGPLDPVAARSALGLPAGDDVVVVSGGGWAVGDLVGAARAAAALPGVEAVVVLGGSRPERRASLEEALAGDDRVEVWGFTDRMPELLAAAAVLVHSTAGLTVLEAQLQGCPVVSYGWGGGHIRANNVAFARHGLATIARTRSELDRALRAALAHRPEPSWPRHAAMPAAADVVLALAQER